MERLTRISLETAKLAQELGYSWKSDINYYYFEGKLVRDWLIPPFGNQEAYLAPEQELLSKWLRDIKYLSLNVFRGSVSIKWEVNNIIEILNNDYDSYYRIDDMDEKYFNTYEEAKEESLIILLNYIKENMK